MSVHSSDNVSRRSILRAGAAGVAGTLAAVAMVTSPRSATAGPTGPEVVGSSPANGGPIEPNQPWALGFDAPLDPATLSSMTVFVEDHSASTVHPTSLALSGTSTVIITPTTPYNVGHLVMAYVTSGLRDMSGRPAVPTSLSAQVVPTCW